MKKTIFTLILALTCNYISAQDGLNDPTFNPGTGIGSTPNMIIASSAIQADGKIIIGGRFSSYNGIPRKSIARINIDGSLDNNFAPGTLGIEGGFNYELIINTIFIQPDGKILIGGSFSSYNGTSRNCIARLNQDGSLDNTFQIGTGFEVNVTGNSSYDLLYPSINSIAMQTDGKIVVGGVFEKYNGNSRNHIARLNTDGSLDANFDIQLYHSYSNLCVTSVAIQSDNKIIFAGNFRSSINTPPVNMLRANQDGTMDNTLNYNGNNAYAEGYITDLNILNDGSLVFLFQGNNNDQGLKRFSNTGVLIFEYPIKNVGKMLIQLDEKIVVGYSYRGNNSNPGPVLRRFNSDLTVDLSFISNNNSYKDVRALSLQSDGKIVFGGNFTDFHISDRNGIARTYNCNPLTYIDNRVACDYLIWRDNNTYTANNSSATYTPSNAIGCDSLLTLNLTIISSVDNTISNANGTLSANQPGASYQWLNCTNGNSIIPGKTGQTFTPTQDGKYAVRITAGTCTETSACVDFIMGDDLSSNLVENNSFLLSPNPASTSFTITNAPVESELTILDVTGKTIYRSTVSDNQTIVQTSNFNNGIYFVHVEFNGSKSVKKLILNK